MGQEITSFIVTSIKLHGYRPMGSPEIRWTAYNCVELPQFLIGARYEVQTGTMITFSCTEDSARGFL